MLGLLLFLAQAANPGLVDQARALPPEFCADAMLRLAASPLLTDTKQRRGLIEEAFAAGTHAPLPYRPVPDDLHNGLEALTLQTRAVNAMLALDAVRALACFATSHRPIRPASPAGCVHTGPVGLLSDSRAPVRIGIQRQGEGRGRRLQFLQQIIASIQSPSQVVPALKMMPDAGARMTAAQRRQLAGAIAGVLDRVAGSDREYAASENVLVPSALPEMHDSQMFVPALRSYIVRHLSAARCSDAIPAGGLPESARQFNALIARLSPTTAQLRPITLEESQPLRVDGTLERPPSPSGQPAGAGLHFLEQQYAASGNHEIWFSQVQAMLKTAGSPGELGEMVAQFQPHHRAVCQAGGLHRPALITPVRRTLFLKFFLPILFPPFSFLSPPPSSRPA